MATLYCWDQSSLSFSEHLTRVKQIGLIIIYCALVLSAIPIMLMVIAYLNFINPLLTYTLHNSPTGASILPGPGVIKIAGAGFSLLF